MTTNSCHAPFGCAMRKDDPVVARPRWPALVARQRGQAARPRRPWPARSRCRTRRSCSALNAIDLPSGDHAGSRSTVKSAGEVTTRFASLPSGAIVQIASNQLAARRLLSGDHAASRTPVGPAREGAVCARGRGGGTTAAATAMADDRHRSETTAGMTSRRQITAAHAAARLVSSGSLDGVDDRAGGDAVAIDAARRACRCAESRARPAAARGSPDPTRPRSPHRRDRRARSDLRP